MIFNDLTPDLLPVLGASRSSVNPLTQIGAALSGFASGVRGQPNPVVAQLQAQQELEAQQAARIVALLNAIEGRRIEQKKLTLQTEAGQRAQKQFIFDVYKGIPSTGTRPERVAKLRAGQAAGILSPALDVEAAADEVDLEKKHDQMLAFVQEGIDPFAPEFSGYFSPRVFGPLAQQAHAVLAQTGPLGVNAMRFKKDKPETIMSAHSAIIEAKDPTTRTLQEAKLLSVYREHLKLDSDEQKEVRQMVQTMQQRYTQSGQLPPPVDYLLEVAKARLRPPSEADIIAMSAYQGRRFVALTPAEQASVAIILQEQKETISARRGLEVEKEKERQRLGKSLPQGLQAMTGQQTVQGAEAQGFSIPDLATKPFRDLMAQRTMTKGAIEQANEIQAVLRRSPETHGASGTVTRLSEGIVSQVRNFASLLGIEVTAPEGLAAYQGIFSETGIKSAALQSQILSLAFLMAAAKGLAGRELTTAMIQLHLKELGAAGQSPEAFLTVLEDLKHRLDRRYQLDSEALLHKAPPSLLLQRFSSPEQIRRAQQRR